MQIGMIVATGLNGQIGIENKIPWRLKSDFKHFKETTMGGTLIMGRKTFESIPGGPLLGRSTIVVTRNKDYKLSSGGLVAHSLFHALSLAEDIQSKNVWICGGTEIYKEGLRVADKMMISEVDYDGEADAYFPEFSSAGWSYKLVKSYNKEETGDNLNWQLFEYNRI